MPSLNGRWPARDPGRARARQRGPARAASRRTSRSPGPVRPAPGRSHDVRAAPVHLDACRPPPQPEVEHAVAGPHRQPAEVNGPHSACPFLPVPSWWPALPSRPGTARRVEWATADQAIRSLDPAQRRPPARPARRGSGQPAQHGREFLLPAGVTRTAASPVTWAAPRFGSPPAGSAGDGSTAGSEKPSDSHGTTAIPRAGHAGPSRLVRRPWAPVDDGPPGQAPVQPLAAGAGPPTTTRCALA